MYFLCIDQINFVFLCYRVLIFYYKMLVGRLRMIKWSRVKLVLFPLHRWRNSAKQSKDWVYWPLNSCLLQVLTPLQTTSKCEVRSFPLDNGTHCQLWNEVFHCVSALQENGEGNAKRQLRSVWKTTQKCLESAVGFISTWVIKIMSLWRIGKKLKSQMQLNWVNCSVLEIADINLLHNRRIAVCHDHLISATCSTWKVLLTMTSGAFYVQPYLEWTTPADVFRKEKLIFERFHSSIPTGWNT